MTAPLLGRCNERKVGMFTIHSHQSDPVQQGSPVAAHQASGTACQGCRTIRVVQFGDLRYQSECCEVGVDMAAVQAADVFDTDAVDRIDLGDHQVDETGIRKTHNQFVDDTAGTGFENLDAEQVATNGPDSACHLAERARPIG